MPVFIVIDWHLPTWGYPTKPDLYAAETENSLMIRINCENIVKWSKNYFKMK